MRKHKKFLNEGNNMDKHNKNKAKKENSNSKIKNKIHKEISELINQNMDLIKSNLNNSNASININKIFNTLDKENFINYNGENISIISNSNSNNEEENLKEKEIQEEEKNIFIFESPSVNNSINNKDNNNNECNLKSEENSSRNLPIFDSSSTSNTCKKKINNKSINKINYISDFSPKSENIIINSTNDVNNIKIIENEFINFFSEINLPIVYTYKFIENGFDDLNILIEMTKNGTAINNQNLKDIGISKAGDRAKILIHLEEKAGVFPIILENKIVYDNDCNCNSLGKFLLKYNCQKYKNNFQNNGYYNSELLYYQMLTREPINQDNIIDDFGIKDEYYINNILKGLEFESQLYFNKLRKINKILDVNNTYKYSCDSCSII